MESDERIETETGSSTPKSRLPDFVIVGAPRSGSTALFRYLSHHPSIYMAEPKEVRFFNEHFDLGVDWYRERFVGARHDQKAGEATPRYMHGTETVDRMAKIVPDARLIAILRDPIDRVYSHYWMDRIRGRADSTFEVYLESSDRVELGHYVDRLRYLGERFQRDQLLVLFYEDLRERPRDVYSEACRFIGVDDTCFPTSVGKTINPYVEFRSLTVRTWSNKLPSALSFVKRAVSRLNTRRDVSYPPMLPATRERLAELFSSSNAELSAWLGRDLPGWTTPPQDGPRT